MKRAIALAMALISCISLGGCIQLPQDPTQSTEPPQLTGKAALQGKKVLFVGDSMVFWGHCVMNNSSDEKRYDDRGYFYQLCNANGIDITVTNWTHPGKGLEYIYDNYIANEAYPDRLKDFQYDYIIVSGGRSAMNTGAYMMGILEKYIALFRAANPNVKFLYLVSAAAHKIALNQSFPTDLLNNLDEIEKMGVTIIDWGKVVSDIVDGITPVPGATQEFNFDSFVVSRTEEDGAHPNVLAGYITALMTYCILTGESAVGQPYAFCWDKTLDSRFNFPNYESHNYKYTTTNFRQIFDSPADMAGVQKLVDQCIAEKAYLTYNYAPLE